MCNNGDCFVLLISAYFQIHTYEGSVSEKNPLGNLIFIGLGVIRSLASMTFLVRSRGQ